MLGRDTKIVRLITPNTLAAHFNDDEYTENELAEIHQFAEFVKTKRPSSPELAAAHARTDITPTPEGRHKTTLLWMMIPNGNKEGES